MAEPALSKNTLNQLNAIINCDPTHCLGVQCPVYFEELRLCDAKRTIALVDMILSKKFEGVKTYDC